MMDSRHFFSHSGLATAGDEFPAGPDVRPAAPVSRGSVEADARTASAARPSSRGSGLPRFGTCGVPRPAVL